MYLKFLDSFYYLPITRMKFEGIVKVITAPEQVNDTLTKRTLVLEQMWDSQYKESLAIDFLKTATKDSIALLDKVNEGDIVSVSINTRCNESNSQPGKYFNSISGWKVDVKAQATQPAAA